MEEQFKRYLEEAFRAIPPTKEAKEFRIQLFNELVDKAQELRINQVTDETLIYKLSIESLGDLPALIYAFEERRLRPESTGNKVSRILLYAFTGIFLFVACYLAISFATKAWSKTWLMLVGGIFAGIIAVCAVTAPKLLRSKKFALLRFELAATLALVFIYVFLLVLMLSSWGQSWILFLIMVTVILAADAVLAFLLKSKTKILSLCIAVQVFTVMLYVICGVTGAFAWHPFWLIPVLGVVANLVIVGSYLSARKKKAAKQKADENNYDDSNYTAW